MQYINTIQPYKWNYIKDNIYPKTEKKVILCVEYEWDKNTFMQILMGFYEDGTIPIDESEIFRYSYEPDDLDYLTELDKEKDAYILCAGWYEEGYEFSYANVTKITGNVIAWMPLPELPT